MPKIGWTAIAVVVLAAFGGIAWLATHRASSGPAPGALSGSVEIRQVDLAFNAEGSVRSMAKREGDPVHAGELVAELDDDAYTGAHALALARRDAAKARLDLLEAGTRPEEIDRARANVASAQAMADRAEATFARLDELLRRNVASRQAYDDALMTRDSARGALTQYQAALAEAVAGARPQEIEVARAELRVAEAAVKLAELQLSHLRLYAPADGVVLRRVAEPGTVVQPASAVYSMAITGEVWVRAFAPETLLGRVAPGTEVRIAGDGGHAWRGRIGFVSPVAEGAPEPRTEPLYRLRIRVEDPDETVRQGMAVTITLPGVG